MTEDEIRRGIISTTSPGEHCYWFKRVIGDINIEDKKSGFFVDKIYGKDELDIEAQQNLNILREVDLPNVLPEGNISAYYIKWSKNGINPSQDMSHDNYINNLCDDFYSVLTAMIQRAIDKKKSKESRKEDIFDEVFQHARFCQKKCESFYGRDVFLQDIENEVRNGSKILIFHGESGCGKTSVMAKLASSIKQWIGDPKAILVLRFIGTTTNSFAIRNLLKSICLQLVKATGREHVEMPEVIYNIVECKRFWKKLPQKC